MNDRIIIIKVVMLFVVFLLFGGMANSTNYYISTNGNDAQAGTSVNPWATFHHAFDSMTGGDTLYVKNGKYAQGLRFIPSGSATKYTVVKAENDFQVELNGEGDNDPLRIDGDYSYIHVEGIKFNGLSQRNVANIYGHHVKIMKCAFWGSPCIENTTVVVAGVGSNYVLFEDCWAWGCGRYKFMAYQADHVIFRRCVSRFDNHDDVNWKKQCATFTTYDTKNTLYQNCIAIDSGQEEDKYGHMVGGIWMENNDATINNIFVYGSIFLNIDATIFNDPKILGTHILKNNVVWHCNGGSQFLNFYDTGLSIGNPSFTVDHVTMGDIYGNHQDYTPAGGVGFTGLSGFVDFPSNITNSIFYACNAYGIGTDIHSDNNNFFNNTANFGIGANTPGIHDIFKNPNIKYMCRAEDNSPLKGLATDGGVIGATILKRYGVSGTLWGEIGFDSLTKESLWPFPNEQQIKSDMGSYTGPNFGKRGFCLDGNGLYGGPITLTSYIWEYLGNSCPNDICGFGTNINNLPDSKTILDLKIHGIYPNPCHTSSLLTYSVLKKGKTYISVQNILGKEVALIIDRNENAGEYSVQIDFEKLNVENGLYFCKISAGNQSKNIRIVYVK